MTEPDFIVEVIDELDGVEVIDRADMVEVMIPGIQGPPGAGGFPSSDPNNRSRSGTDGGIYTPELMTDPLAYYILSKS